MSNQTGRGDNVAEDSSTKVTKQQLTKQQPSNNIRQQPIRKEKEWRKRRLNKAKWRDNEIMGYRALMESLEDGAGPTGKVAVLTLEEAKNARELADLHMIIDKFWIVLDDQPSLEYTDRHMSICPKEQAEIHVVDLERAGPTRRWTIPLRLPAGQWPIPEPRIEKVQETLEPVELTAIRVTVVREYTDPKIWKKLKKSGQTILELATSIKGQDVRTYGWQHTDLGKEEFLTGYIKVPKGQEEALLGPAAWPESLLAVAERLKTDPEYKRQKVLWVERETAETSMDYFARVATQASAGKARIIWRRGGNNALGVEGASNAPPGWTRVCIQGSPFWWGPNATKQYLERRGIDVMTASMSPPRTKAQGWLLLAKSDTKDMEQDHFWVCGEHDITCRKWKKGPPKNATVTAVAGNGARWKRGDDEKNENKKPNEGTKVVPMTGVEEQPEDTEETGQQPADGRNKETATPVPAKIQQHEQYEHHRLIDPGSNGGDCGFRAFAIALGQLNNKTATEAMDPNRLQKNVATLRHKAHASFKSQTAWKQFWEHETPKPPSPQRGDNSEQRRRVA